MKLKTWKPAQGCPECARAAEMFGEHTKMAMTTNAQYLAKVQEQQATINRLLEGYREAIEDIEDWAAYAGDFFQQKHDLAGCLAAHRATLWPED